MSPLSPVSLNRPELVFQQEMQEEIEDAFMDIDDQGPRDYETLTPGRIFI